MKFEGLYECYLYSDALPYFRDSAGAVAVIAILLDYMSVNSDSVNTRL